MSGCLFVADWDPQQRLAGCLLAAASVPSGLKVRDAGELEGAAGQRAFPFPLVYQSDGQTFIGPLAIAEAFDRTTTPRLLGGDARERGRIRSAAHILDECFTVLASSVIETWPAYDGCGWGSEEALEAPREIYRAKMAAVARFHHGEAFLLGERVTLADALLAAIVLTAQDMALAPAEGEPALAGWIRRHCVAGGLFGGIGPSASCGLAG